LLFGFASTHIKDQCVFHLQGIVAAIRQLGGRFLEHNEDKHYYFDIGDKKVRYTRLYKTIICAQSNLNRPVLFLFALQLSPQATEKTSQALREGQKNIRKKMFGTKYGIFTGTAAPEDTDELSDVIMPAEPENCGKQLLPPVSHPKYID
jgi:hypothetical protein